MRKFLALFLSVVLALSAQQPVLIRQNSNTATVSAGGALKTDGSAVTQPVSGTVTTTPPANASTNVTQVGGTAVDTNSGNKSAGTLRVTLATDQVQLTNALKVDGSAVTQPVSAASLPLPTGASTSAKQPALGTAGASSTDVISVQGIASMTPLDVTCSSGCSSSPATVDDSAFTAGSSTASPTAGVYDDTLMAVTSGNSAAPRITPNRGLHINLRNNSGTEIGTSGAPVRVDPTGSTTQPVSAASLPLPTGASTAAKQPALGTAGSASTDVITVQGITSMTALKVDGSGVTQPVSGTVTTTPPANASTNVTQLAGTGVDTNSGNKSAGTLRVTLATDQIQLTNALKVDGSAVTQPVSGTVSITANSAVNVAQVGGTAVDTNSGNKSAGTQRIVLATDQPNLTTPLNVALAANQSTNVAQINGVTPLMGNGATGTGAIRVSIANDSTGVVQPGNTANTTPWLGAPATEATTANSALTSYLTSAASTNSTNVKNGAGNVYGYSIVNTTATLYYLRMYNLSSAPTCSSATGFVETIPIPASATGAGVVRQHSVPQGFTTGIGFCLTGGGSSTDNTNAATGVYLTILYK